ncbi:porin family protein [Pseudoflavitalea rhizosphaerae]|uniref:porin family protein n=1 Tax=Pseudoflavitalea rhizosphaerae TaxID=1884793 RepID=UPI0013DF5CFD|nr:porin family protein [Pseudoflavitalea rhizosphaerae]
MKKTFLALLLAFGCYASNAQEATTTEPRARFGIKAGINSSGLNTHNEEAQLSSIESFYAGGIAVFPVSKHFNIQSELIFSGEGSKTSGVKLDLGYVRLPILFQYEHNSGFHAEAGPQIGILVHKKAIQEVTKEEFEIGDQLTQVSTTIAIGFGYRMKNGLGIDFRYAKGIDNPIGANNAKLVVASGGLSFIF